MLKTLIKKEQGDTIVEVLISLAILTLVLAGAYYTASQSFRNDRDAQEHSEALTIAQTELEDLRTYNLSRASSSAFDPTTDNCLDSTLKAYTGTCWTNSSNTTIYTGMNASSNCLAVSPYCFQVQIGPTTGPTSAPAINTGVMGVSSVTPQTYTINVTWAALGGGNDEVTLYYRVNN